MLKLKQRYVVQAKQLTQMGSIYQEANNYAFSRDQQQQQESEQISNDWYIIKDNIFVSAGAGRNYGSNPNQWVLINNLRPDMSYQFRISAINGIGEGMPSRDSNKITIPEEVPSGWPQNIQAYALSSNVVHTKWSQPPFKY